MTKFNPRRVNGYKRDKAVARLKSRGDCCALCGKPIDYSLGMWVDPKDGKRKRHPYSFEADDIVPVSRGGCPWDINNLQASHRICNQRKGNKGRSSKIEALKNDKRKSSRSW